MESDLNSSHIILKLDVSEECSTEINVPSCLLEEIKNYGNRMGEIKIQFGVKAVFDKEDGEIKEWEFSNNARLYDEEFINQGIIDLKAKIEIYSGLSSGWRLILINEITMTLTKYQSIIHRSGSSYLKSPEELKQTLACVNVQNKDEYCFLYSILAVINYGNIARDRERATKYNLKELNYEESWFPMKLINIARFEKANPGLAINVLSYKTATIKQIEYKNPNVDIIYRSKSEGRQIYLLLLQEEDNYHYVAVTNLDRLLNYRKDQTRIQSKWCEICLHGFQLEAAYNEHIALCKKNVERTTLFKMPNDSVVCFKDWSKTVTKEFVVYADFESILPPDPKYHQKHEPIAAGAVLIQHGAAINNFMNIGPNCVVEFLEWVEKTVTETVYPWYEKNGNVPMLPLTQPQKMLQRNAKNCYMCNNYSKKLVRDHDHFTGQYLGPACDKCNLSRRVRPSLEVVFHNLKGYDMHHILKYAVSKFTTWELEPIPTSTEKFLALTARFNKKTVRFIDSYAFLSLSLSKLADNMISLPLTRQVFESPLMDGKGIFPYDFATSLEVLDNTRCLPPKWTGVTDEEYAKAQSVWTIHNCETMRDYMEIYLMLDVYLLADVFECFRRKSKAEDGLEPLSFFGIPGMSWCSALKMLKHKVELIQDDELYTFFERGIRGGMTFINKHHVEATEDKSLLYIDINNLYGWALSQKLPCGEFEWVEPSIEYLEYPDSYYGYVFEVDLHIPKELHDKFNDLPIAPEPGCPPGSKVKKLLLTHKDKTNYVVHGKLLSFWLNLGVQITKMHRVVRFKQDFIFKEYVDYNTKMRAAATNKFDKDFYKLKNNSLYGKTVENLKKRLNLRLCNSEVKMVAHTSNPMFRRSMKIADDLIAILLNKDEITLDRPSYIGQAVLDLSKLRMYQLQYEDLEHYRQRFNCKIDIVAGDTDSFFVQVHKIDSQILLSSMKNDGLLDTSNYKPDHPLYSTEVSNKIGLFKDESGGFPFKEWIFLRPKCYSLLYENQEEVHKAKGIVLKGTQMNHQKYKEVYDTGGTISVPQTNFITRDHQLYTHKSTKLALKCHDDKRYWVTKNGSLAYGHYGLLYLE